VSEDQQATTRRRFHTWVTDVVYMRNTQKVVLTTSSREIYFYDVSTPVYTIEFCLYGMLQDILTATLSCYVGAVFVQLR